MVSTNIRFFIYFQKFLRFYISVRLFEFARFRFNETSEFQAGMITARGLLPHH